MGLFCVLHVEMQKCTLQQLQQNLSAGGTMSLTTVTILLVRQLECYWIVP